MRSRGLESIHVLTTETHYNLGQITAGKNVQHKSLSMWSRYLSYSLVSLCISCRQWIDNSCRYFPFLSATTIGLPFFIGFLFFICIFKDELNDIFESCRHTDTSSNKACPVGIILWEKKCWEGLLIYKCFIFLEPLR